MQITLPPDLEQLIETQLNSGSFLNADEVVQEALQIGINDINAGRSKLYPTALATDIKQLARQQQSRSSL